MLYFVFSGDRRGGRRRGKESGRASPIYPAERRKEAGNSSGIKNWFLLETGSCTGILAALRPGFFWETEQAHVQVFQNRF